MSPNDPEYLEELERVMRRMLDEIAQRRAPEPQPSSPPPLDQRERLWIAVAQTAMAGTMAMLFLVALYLWNAE